MTKSPFKQETVSLSLERKRGVIDILRERFPGTWRWAPMSHRWEHSDGWWVEPRLAMDSDGIRYFRSDTGEELFL